MAAGDGLRELLQWLEEEIIRNGLLVEAMASGKLEIRSWQDGQGMVDTTADSLEQAKLRVARLKEILATYSREGWDTRLAHGARQGAEWPAGNRR